MKVWKSEIKQCNGIIVKILAKMKTLHYSQIIEKTALLSNKIYVTAT